MTVIVLQPSADTWINKQAPATNYGAATELQDHKTTMNRVLMKFDLSAIPVTAHIQSAILSVYVDQHSGYADKMDPTIHPLTKDWAELTATWNTPWATPGGDFDKGLFAFFTQAWDPAALNQAYAADIAALVQAWVEGAIPNYGFLMDSMNTGSATAFGLNSREGANPPTLTVTYTDTGLLTPPGSTLDAGQLAQGDNRAYRHPDQNLTMTMADLVATGQHFDVQPSANPLTDISETWIDAAIANGLTPFLTVGLREDTIVGKNYATIFAYGADIATKYAGKVPVYNLGAEANNTYYAYNNPLYSPANVVSYVQAFAEGIHSVDPTALICLAGLGATRPTDYLIDCAALGLAQWSDIWGNGQPYTTGRFGGLLTTITRYMTFARLRDWCLTQGQPYNKSIAYLEEGMMPALVDSIAQAKVICLKTIINQHAGIINEWYKLYDVTQNYRLATFDAQNAVTHFRGYYIIARLNQFVSPRNYSPVWLGSSCSLANVIRLGFKKSDTELVFALWNATATPTDSLVAGTPTDVTVKDYGLIPLKIIDPLTGTSTTPAYNSSGGRLTVTGVPITDYPTLILFGPSGAPAPPTPTPQPDKKKHKTAANLCA